MVQPSQKWLDKFSETLVPEMFVRITYGVTEPGLQEDAIPSTNGETFFSNVSSIVDSESHTYTKYSTGELNFTVLDGNYTLPDRSAESQEAGYISENCVSTSNHPIITLSFSKVHTVTIPGITITWSSTFNEWPTSFKLTAYSGNTVVSTKTVSDNSSITTDIDWEIANYDSISIQILSWCLENRRARVEQIKMVQFIVFEKKDIFRTSTIPQETRSAVNFRMIASLLRWITARRSGTRSTRKAFTNICMSASLSLWSTAWTWTER